MVHNILNTHKSLVIDFTFVEPTARTYVGKYNKTGQAALIGRQNKITNEYKHWNVGGSNLVETQSIQVLRERPQFPIRNRGNSLNSQASVDE